MIITGAGLPAEETAPAAGDAPAHIRDMTLVNAVAAVARPIGCFPKSGSIDMRYLMGRPANRT